MIARRRGASGRYRLAGPLPAALDDARRVAASMRPPSARRRGQPASDKDLMLEERVAGAARGTWLSLASALKSQSEADAVRRARRKEKSELHSKLGP